MEPTATAAAATETKPKDDVSARKGSQISYQDLYRRWEQNNWSAMDIDFSKDLDGWRSLTEMQRTAGLRTYSMFFYGEDAVTDGLSPYIDAAPKEEQKYFLATQQVDEARHAIFFDRFFDEVLGAGDSTSARLAFTESQFNWGYRGVFERLELMCDQLRRDHSLPKLAQAITLYHMIIEGTLAQPGQHFIEDYFVKSGAMPGFSEGMAHVARDEQRHIGFGVKILSELFAESEECKAAVADLLKEVMKYVADVFVPPGWNEEYNTCYGFTLEEMYAWGMRSMDMKWKAAGFPVEEMPPGTYPVDTGLSYEERAVRQIALLKAGVIGAPDPNPRFSPEVQRDFFDMVAGSAHTDAIETPMTIQWKFSDAEPWYLSVNNGSTAATQGTATKPELTIEASWADWIQVSMHGADMRKAMLTRKVKTHGSLRQLKRLGQIFPKPKPVLAA